MTPTALHIFAVNGESDLRHTNLTRAQGLHPTCQRWRTGWGSMRF
jgi:hypothetical protein